jgi:SAM-dependent methyltransferase
VDDPYYRDDLALVHHLGFGFHAADCAPGILGLLGPVRRRGGLVLEVGCGSGLLTTELVAAGHRVVATDASPAMLRLAAETAPGAIAIERLTLPEDPVPEADAIVGVGHALNYLPDADAVRTALVALCLALRPGGVLALDCCDLEWGRAREGLDVHARVEDDWAIVTRYERPSPTEFVREMTTFLRGDDGCWRRGDERHDNVLVDTAAVPAWVAPTGVTLEVAPSFGDERLPVGLRALIGQKA